LNIGGPLAPFLDRVHAAITARRIPSAVVAWTETGAADVRSLTATFIRPVNARSAFRRLTDAVVAV
jgi:hypothetical protein